MNRKAFIALCILATSPGSTDWDGRIGHDTANASAKKPAQGEALSLTYSEPSWRYALFARRDVLSSDRNLLGAAAIAQRGLHFGGNSLYLGVGTHFGRVEVFGQPVQARFSPAAGLHWQSPGLSLEIVGSERLTRAEAAFLVNFALPLELRSFFEYVESQPYRWSVDILAHVSRYGGLIAGFEPIASAPRAGLWFRPVENLSLRALSRVPLGGEVYFEFALAYAWKDTPAAGAAVRIEEAPALPPKARPETKIPAFATLVKWGLAPVTALKLAREKNICSLDPNSRAILARHHWECRDAK